MRKTTTSFTLYPAMPSGGTPTWDGAEWIGEVWVDAMEATAARCEATGLPVECRLVAAEGYRRARLLVRMSDRILGFVRIGIRDGMVDFLELERLVAGIQPAPSTQLAPGGKATRTVSVVICTRDRPALLRMALESVLATNYPDFEAIVVDNASRTTATRDFVRSHTDPRVKLICKRQPGASRARNAGLLAAHGEVVAFVDDDVVVDGQWLRALVSRFNNGPSVSCVSGMVPAGEIRTPAQAYFDKRVGWSDSTTARLYDWSFPPPDVPLFPFAVGRYGTGANFAVKRDVALRLGGFDELLGPGTPTGGGEDLDLFFRILRSGGQLVHDPTAIAWHRHRADSDALFDQTRGYGLGLGAWLAKIANHPATAGLAVKTALLHIPAMVRHLRGTSKESMSSVTPEGLLPAEITRGTWKFIVKGALAYHAALRSQDRPAPLLSDMAAHSNTVPAHPIGCP
jgi:glycosyltransferase involved in cell wall biosynthesis